MRQFSTTSPICAAGSRATPAYLDREAREADRGARRAEVSEPDLWDDRTAARKVDNELAQLSATTSSCTTQLDGTLVRPRDPRRAHAGGERRVVRGRDRRRGWPALGSQLEDLELRALFTGEHDDRDAICTVNSGAGGTDAQDWTNMLLRMYLRWAEHAVRHRDRRGLTRAPRRASSSATFTVKGRHAYGLLARRARVHRLIRISPFDANARRHTAFASFDGSARARRRPRSRRSTRATSASTPTGRRAPAASTSTSPTPRCASRTCPPVSWCRAERALADAEQGARDADPRGAARGTSAPRAPAELDALSGEKRDVAFGSQIRTYTLQPYQLVKDERTRYESGNVQAVLDGEIDDFIEAYLHWRRQSV